MMLKLRIGTMDPRTKEFVEHANVCVQPQQNLNDILKVNTGDVDLTLNYAILEDVFPIRKSIVCRFSKKQTFTKSGKKKVRWYVM